MAEIPASSSNGAEPHVSAGAPRDEPRDPPGDEPRDPRAILHAEGIRMAKTRQAPKSKKSPARTKGPRPAAASAAEVAGRKRIERGASKKGLPLTREALAARIATVRVDVLSAESALDTVIAAIEVLPKESKRLVSVAVEEAFERVRRARAELQELEAVVAPRAAH